MKLMRSYNIYKGKETGIGNHSYIYIYIDRTSRLVKKICLNKRNVFRHEKYLENNTEFESNRRVSSFKDYMKMQKMRLL